MDWRDIPSLAALRAFEAVAREGSFSAAARELNVTHAAVAQHVRGLEADFDTELVFRQGAGMALTDPGQRLAAALTDGFGAIAAGVRELRRDGEVRPVQVTLTHPFAENWLMPRLGAFWAAHPEVSVAIVPSQEVVDLRRDGFDMGVRFGHGDWPGVAAELLVPAHFVIVGRADLVTGVEPGDLRAMERLPWVQEAGWNEEDVWVEELGLDLSGTQVTGLATNTMVLAAVRAGLGISLQNRAMVEPELQAGSLVCLHESHNILPGYHIILPPGPVRLATRVFISWLKAQV